MKYSRPSRKGAEPLLNPAALGIPSGLESVALACARELAAEGMPGKALRRLFVRLVETPAFFTDHPVLGRLAAMLQSRSAPGRNFSDPVPESGHSAPWRAFG